MAHVIAVAIGEPWLTAYVAQFNSRTALAYIEVSPVSEQYNNSSAACLEQWLLPGTG
jgi:hypothetical protein